MTIIEEFTKLLNKYSIENKSDTPDFVLAQYLRGCLDAFNNAIAARDSWYDFKPWDDDKSPSVLEYPEPIPKQIQKPLLKPSLPDIRNMLEESVTSDESNILDNGDRLVNISDCTVAVHSYITRMLIDLEHRDGD